MEAFENFLVGGSRASRLRCTACPFHWRMQQGRHGLAGAGRSEQGQTRNPLTVPSTRKCNVALHAANNACRVGPRVYIVNDTIASQDPLCLLCLFSAGCLLEGGVSSLVSTPNSKTQTVSGKLRTITTSTLASSRLSTRHVRLLQESGKATSSAPKALERQPQDQPRNRFDLSRLECTVPVPGPRLIDCDSAPAPPNSIAYNIGPTRIGFG